MEFEEIIGIFSVFKKLHTSREPNDETIFYRDIKNMNGTMTINHSDVFKLNLISHMSLSSYDGLLIQYDSLDGRKMYPYRLINIQDIKVETDLNDY